MAEALERLRSFISVCECPDQDELHKFADNFGSLHFVCSFQVDHESQDAETETERFLRRVSLVNSQVAVIFQVKNKELTRQQIFSSSKSRCVVDHFISKDCATYAQSPFSVGHLPSCCQMHLVLGERLPLLLPTEAVEAGLCGEISIISLATLGPCMKLYPNWPARLSHIHVLVYSPSGIPIMREEGQIQLSFLQSLADLPFWRKLGLTGIRCADTHTAQGILFYEMTFSAEDEHQPETEPACSQAVSEDLKSEVHTVEQTITVFLLIQYSDPFHSQLFDFITGEEILERQLDKVLWRNAEKVRSALQSLLENTLKRFLSRKKSREKMQSAMSVIVGSVSSIVSSSSSAEFRSACLNSMKVQNTTDLSVAMHQNLQRVLSGRLVSSASCTSGKAVDAAVSGQNDSERVKAG
ncbi:type 2 DNA topoisomerase 6 subunit B-like [Salminus brasiliensis]|uniref:type 2 DNA topoisomerase 6 subunit B-like n=1 Tax=Salminus brasiliensis TaxID=930266 RepID=UPI003B82DB09